MILFNLKTWPRWQRFRELPRIWLEK